MEAQHQREFSDKGPPLRDLITTLGEQASDLFRKELLLARVETARDVTAYLRNLRRPAVSLAFLFLSAVMASSALASLFFVVLFSGLGLGLWFSLVASPLLAALTLGGTGYFLAKSLVAGPPTRDVTRRL